MVFLNSKYPDIQAIHDLQEIYIKKDFSKLNDILKMKKIFFEEDAIKPYFVAIKKVIYLSAIQQEVSSFKRVKFDYLCNTFEITKE